MTTPQTTIDGTVLPTVVVVSDIKQAEFRKIPYDEMLEISYMLEDYHKIFYTFYSLSAMYFTDAIPTAAVRFHKYGKPDLLLGEAFWQSLTADEKVFVIIHECLHVFLDHGVRNGMTIPGATPYLVNIAQDITINEMIVTLFGFDRNLIRNWDRYCWIQTCFKNPAAIAKNETFTYYLKELIKNASEAVGNQSMMTLDMHGSAGNADGTLMPGQGESDEEKAAKEAFAKDLAEELSAGELEKIKDSLPESVGGGGQGAGTMDGAYELIIKRKSIRARLKIGKLIAKMKRSVMTTVDVEVETFTARDRRFQGILSRNPDMHLPGTGMRQKHKKEKLLVALYTDISGSCIAYIPLFKKILLAFMEEKEVMTTIAHTFDTRVQTVQYDTVIHGGGGTAFHIIEENNRKLEEEIGRYPDVVIVITDGEGNSVRPKMPNRWIWLLTPVNDKQYIHHKSKWFLTKDVIFE